MTIIDQITQMKGQGVPDDQIIANLQQQGISPRQINDALSQAQVRTTANANSNPNSSQESVVERGMEPSIMSQGQQSQTDYTQSTQGIQEDIEPPSPTSSQPTPEQEYNQEYFPPEQQYANEANYYPQQQYGYDSNTDTMIEISEQVFQEKISAIRKKVQEIEEFKTIAETRIETISKRLEKLESIIDNIQAAILDKISSYGSEIEPIKKEMEMMQDSFGKLITPLTDKASQKYHENRQRKTTVRKKHSKKKTGKRKTHKRKSKTK